MKFYKSQIINEQRMTKQMWQITDNFSYNFWKQPMLYRMLLRTKYLERIHIIFLKKTLIEIYVVRLIITHNRDNNNVF